MNKLPLSALVVGCNESDILSRCLSSIQFCSELIYVDLESIDESSNIAKLYNAKIFIREKVPMVEMVHVDIVPKTKHDWILIIDPDECVSTNLFLDIEKMFKNEIPENYGGIYVPCLFYFKQHALKGTPWGGQNYRLLLLNKKRYELTSNIHSGRNPIPPFIDYFLPYNEVLDNVDHHYWMRSYTQLFEKHWRYLKIEPKTRFSQGKRASVKRILGIFFVEFHYAFISKKGYKDKGVGLFLSLFWAGYQFLAEFGLYRFQKKNI